MLSAAAPIRASKKQTAGSLADWLCDDAKIKAVAKDRFGLRLGLSLRTAIICIRRQKR
jgi:hypothetical protein